MTQPRRGRGRPRILGRGQVHFAARARRYGVTWSAIARALGCARSTCREAVRREAAH